MVSCRGHIQSLVQSCYIWFAAVITCGQYSTHPAIHGSLCYGNPKKAARSQGHTHIRICKKLKKPKNMRSAAGAAFDLRVVEGRFQLPCFLYGLDALLVACQRKNVQRNRTMEVSIWVPRAFAAGAHELDTSRKLAVC